MAAEKMESKKEELLEERRQLFAKVQEYDGKIHSFTKNKNIASERIKEIDKQVKALGGA